MIICNSQYEKKGMGIIFDKKTNIWTPYKIYLQID